MSYPVDFIYYFYKKECQTKPHYLSIIMIEFTVKRSKAQSVDSHMAELSR